MTIDGSTRERRFVWHDPEGTGAENNLDWAGQTLAATAAGKEKATRAGSLS